MQPTAKNNTMVLQSSGFKNRSPINNQPVDIDSYKQYMGKVYPLAVTSNYGNDIPQLTSSFVIPENIAHHLFNVVLKWLRDMQPYTFTSRRSIALAERYYKALVGSESGKTPDITTFLGDFMYNSNLQNSSGPQKTRIPHHYNLVLREGNILSGVFSKPPNSRIVPLDSRDVEHIESAEAATKLHDGLLNGIDQSSFQRELFRKIYTGCTVFVKNTVCDDYDCPPLDLYTFNSKEVVKVPGSLMCNVCGYQEQFPVSPEEMKIPEVNNKKAPTPPPVETIPSEQSLTQCPACGYDAQLISPLKEIHYYPEVVQQFKGRYASQEIHTNLTVITPALSKLEECHWLVEDVYVPMSKVLHDYPHLKPYWRSLVSSVNVGAFRVNSSGLDPENTIRNTIAEHEYRSYYGMQNVQVTRCWICPEQYECLEYQGTDETKDFLQKHFKEGVVLTFVQQKLVHAAPANLHDTWSCLKPDSGAGLYCRPMADPVIAANRVVNTAVALLLLSLRSAIPLKIYRKDVINDQAINDAAAGITEMLPVSKAVANLRDVFHETTPSTMQPAAKDATEFFSESIRTTMGTGDQITGSFSGSQALTLGGDQMRFEQALKQHLPLWESFRQVYSGSRLKLMKMILKNVLFKVETGQQTLINEQLIVGVGNSYPAKLRIPVEQQEVIKRGGWKVWTDESIPMNPTQVRNMVVAILQSQIPELIQNTLMSSPSNIGKLQEIILPNGFETPRTNEITRIQSIINRLSQEKPPTQFDQVAQREVPVLEPEIGVPQSSIPISPQDTDPMLCYQVVYEWMQTREAQVLRGNGLEPGPYYQNVMNWGIWNKTYVSWMEQQQRELQMKQQGRQNRETNMNVNNQEEPQNTDKVQPDKREQRHIQ